VIRALALVPVLLALAACGGGSASAPPTTRSATTAPAAKGTLHVVMSADSHHPQLRHAWTYSVRVTDAANGKPVAATIHLQFFFAGSSVGEVGRHVVANGVWKETIPATGKDAFPPAAVGQPLVLRAAVKAKGYRPATAGWKVQVVK
jgi:hypothetical protein